jgi:hypothetical protein
MQITKQCTWISLNLTRVCNQVRRWVERKFSSSKYISSVQWVKREVPKLAKCIYRETSSNRAVGQKSGAPDAPTHRHRTHSVASGAPDLAMCLARSKFNGHFSEHRTRSTPSTQRPIHSSKQPKTIFAHRTRPMVGQWMPLRPVHTRVRRSYWRHVAIGCMNSTTSTSGAATPEHPMLDSSEVAARRIHRTLGQRPMLWEPVSGAPEASVRCTKNSEEHFQKFAESCLASLTERRKGPKSISTAQTPPHLQMCQYQQVFTTLCMCVSIFTIIFSKKLASH